VKLSKAQVREIILEEVRKTLILERIVDDPEIGQEVVEAAEILAVAFKVTALELLKRQVVTVAGEEVSDVDWKRHVTRAGDQLNTRLHDAIRDAITQVEEQLYQGWFR